MDLLNLLIVSLWLMIPASLSNTAAAVGVHIMGKSDPLDFGKSIKGRRILGDGKTFQGFIIGVASGIILGNIELFFAKPLNLPQFSHLAIITLPVGALIGDIVSSFFKRRINIDRGKSLPIFDQLDFVFGAWILTIIFDHKWFLDNFSFPVIIIILIIIPVLHLIFNIVGHKIGVCREPW